ncbi:MAG: glycosyl transferase [Hydrogenophilales bacterium 28-61-23]|nr:MAG: glycosyl transferase [Hydrogenophilales bacterium 28-61-23]
MIVFEILIGTLTAIILTPTIVLFVQVLLAWTPSRGRALTDRARPRLAVLIPAHNEAAVIAETLRPLLAQLVSSDRILVVADNCSDDTAKIAADKGAEVVERSDPDHRGKGYALDFGIRHLAADPPETVIIVDADCHAMPDAIDRLARQCATTQSPVQTLYLMRNSPGASLKQRIAEFAWLVKNRVRPLGSHRLGVPCQLMGTGMAFPWALICQAKLANSELVEDMKLGIDLALAGHPPVFCVEALVTSQFPESAPAVDSQRTRWEHGHLGMIMLEAPRLIGRALIRGDLRLLAMALDLAVPPLALLVVLISSLFAIAFAGYWAGLSALPLVLSSAALGLLTFTVLLAWLGWGRRILPFADLLSIPLYVLGKAPIYLKFWTKRQKDWVRTSRD